MSASSEKLKAGDLENRVLNGLWDLGQSGQEKVFVTDIVNHLRSSRQKWAYTTIKTVLDRMVDKGMLVRLKEGNRYYYQSVVNRDDLGAIAVERLLKQYFQGDLERLKSSLAHLLSDSGITNAGIYSQGL